LKPQRYVEPHGSSQLDNDQFGTGRTVADWSIDTAMASSRNCTLRIVYLLLLSFHVVAFTPLPMAKPSPKATASIRRHLSPLETEILESATTTLVAAVAADTDSGSAVANFLLGSAVFVGAVATLKWNGAEYSDTIREKWEDLTAQPAPLEESFVPGSTTPLAAEASSSSGMPVVKKASSPQELTEMMKDVSDSIGSSKKKKRFVVKLLQKVVMPWRKWSSL
jgi:hypothetical protein